MQILKIIAQIVGLLALLFGITLLTLRIDNQDADGPSILFPGGKLVSGDMHTGPDPDWSFTDDAFTIELQLDDPLSSRTIFIMESDGKIYVPSGYMRSFLGRLWKDWAFQAYEGDGLGVLRVNGVRYERQLVRVMGDDPALDGVARKLAKKYGGSDAPEAIAGTKQSVVDGDTWIFELAPRGA
ncbi:MAG: hypothetical protein GKR90_17105 [Pseudomonadales bacterium]|nr:hypothetical protein [Pseudomonadales bacterium]